MVVSLVAHATLGLGISWAALSNARGMTRAVSAIAVNVSKPGETASTRTTWATTRVAVSAAAPTRATIRLVPAPVAVARPVASTRATVESLLVQCGLAVERTLLLESSATAKSWIERPTVRRVSRSGRTVTAAATCVTVTSEVSATPSAAAVIVVAPSSTAVTSPVSFTAATVGCALNQLTGTLGTAALFASNAVALSRVLAPRRVNASAGESTTTRDTTT